MIILEKIRLELQKCIPDLKTVEFLLLIGAHGIVERIITILSNRIVLGVHEGENM